MALVSRPYQPTDSDGFHRVRSLVYRGGEPVAQEENLFPSGALGTVVEINGEIVGAATSLHLPMLLRGEPILCGGVAAVGVIPHARRTGAGSELMRGVNRQLREEGFEFAALYAYRETWYRKFGYEVCGGRIKVTCPADRLPGAGQTAGTRILPTGDIASLEPVYTAFATRYSGMNLRNPDLWERVVGSDSTWTLFAVGDPACAYAVVKLEPNFWVPQTIREVAWSSYEGYRGLLALFQALATNKTELSWYEPLDSPLLTSHLDQGIHLELERQTMFRLLRVQDILQRCRVEDEIMLRIGVTDPDFDENDGTWLVAADASGAEVRRTIELPDVTVTIQQLTQIVMGEPSAQTLCNAGQITCADEATYDSLTALFPGYRSYCMDFY